MITVGSSRGGLLQFFPCGIGVLSAMMNRRWDTAQVQPERAGMESCIHEEASHGMCGDRLTVDGGDECALMAVRTQAILTSSGEEMRETRGHL